VKGLKLEYWVCLYGQEDTDPYFTSQSEESNWGGVHILLRGLDLR
jgi:hypothetical protein